MTHITAGLGGICSKMEGRFILGYADGLNKPETPIDLKDDAAKEALDFLAQHSETKQRFDKVAMPLH